MKHLIQFLLMLLCTLLALAFAIGEPPRWALAFLYAALTVCIARSRA
jgi:hypothetical protein